MVYLGRQGVRSLLRSPVFTLTTVASLGVGIGACTAVFAVVRASLFAELPYREPDRLVELWSTENPRTLQRIDLVPADRVFDWLDRDFASLESLAARGDVALVLDGETPMRVEGEAVSGGFFDLLGVAPLRGRTLGPDDDRPGADPAVVLSQRLWEERFDGSRAALGQVARMSGVQYTIVGVMPRRFDGRSRMWVAAEGFREDAMAAWLPVGRLKEGASVDDAATEVQRRAAMEHAADSTLFGGMGAAAIQLGSTSAASSPMLWVTAGAVGALFLLALTNLTSLFLVRAGERGRTTAVRLALGASRAQLGTALFLESALLALAGAALGLVLASWGHDLIRASLPSMFDGPVAPTIDLSAFALAAGLALCAAVLVGLEPLRHLSSLDLRGLMQSGGSLTAPGAAQRRTRNLVLSVQIALIVLFASVAGALTLGYSRFTAIDMGYDSDRVVMALPDYDVRPMTRDEQLDLGEAAVARIRNRPGIAGATYWRKGTQAYPPRPEADAVLEASVPMSEIRPRQRLYHYFDVGPDFFEVMGIPIAAGRAFGPTDGPGSPAVGIVTAVGADAWWPGDDPIGRQIQLGRDGESITIVGVTPDVEYLHQEGRGFAAAVAARGGRPLPLLFRSASQRRPPPPGWIEDGVIIGLDGVVLAARASSATGPVAEMLTAEAATLAPELPLERVGTLEDWERDGYLGITVRLYRVLVTSVAGAGLLVALLGITGAVSDAVLRRTHEIGIRKALGARPGQVTRSLVSETMTAVAGGAVVGLLPLLALQRVIGSEPAYNFPLLGVSLLDWRVLLPVAAMVLLIAAAAAALSARRADRIEPAAALRVD